VTRVVPNSVNVPILRVEPLLIYWNNRIPHYRPIPSGVYIMSFDPSALEAYREFMGEEADAFIATVIQDFIKSAPELIRTMEEGLTTEDRVVMVRAAHTLKSNGATIGAHKLAEMCADLEKTGKDAPAEVLAPKIAQAKDELNQVISELSAR
jgi:HPt (histidine-containing phosphotransfer) domain-containing protein